MICSVHYKANDVLAQFGYYFWRIGTQELLV